MSPIRAENRGRYPADWPKISARIRARSGGRCECVGECGIDHRDQAERLLEDEGFDPALAHRDGQAERCIEVNGKAAMHFQGRVVLTVAHLDHMPEHCDDTNLRAWCQRCHLRYDAPVKRRDMQRRKHAAMGCGDLFGVEE